MIGVICFNSLRYAQFVYKYTDLFDSNNIQYEVVYWNREGDSVGRGSNWISYEKRVNTFQPFYKKVFRFIGFTRFMFKTIKIKDYDKLIILTTQTAVPLFTLLTGKYKNRYIYDYRDITYENFCIYKKIVNKLIDSSYFTAISSKGFIESKYLYSHDGKFIISHNSRDLSSVTIDKIPSQKIRIVYWGQVRQPEFNKRICDYFGNDERFFLTYHGAGFHEELVKYVEDKHYNNIRFTGAYNIHDIESFVKETDFVLNLYENDKQQQPAMTVKFYDSLKYSLPMIVAVGSYMGEVVKENYLGITFNNSIDPDFLFEELRSFDFVRFNYSCKVYRDRILAEDQLFFDSVFQFCAFE